MRVEFCFEGKEVDEEEVSIVIRGYWFRFYAERFLTRFTSLTTQNKNRRGGILET